VGIGVFEWVYNDVYKFMDGSEHRLHVEKGKGKKKREEKRLESQLTYFCSPGKWHGLEKGGKSVQKELACSRISTRKRESGKQREAPDVDFLEDSCRDRRGEERGGSD